MVAARPATQPRLALCKAHLASRLERLPVSSLPCPAPPGGTASAAGSVSNIRDRRLLAAPCGDSRPAPPQPVSGQPPPTLARRYIRQFPFRIFLREPQPICRAGKGEVICGLRASSQHPAPRCCATVAGEVAADGRPAAVRRGGGPAQPEARWAWGLAAGLAAGHAARRHTFLTLLLNCCDTISPRRPRPPRGPARHGPSQSAPLGRRNAPRESVSLGNEPRHPSLPPRLPLGGVCCQGTAESWGGSAAARRWRRHRPPKWGCPALPRAAPPAAARPLVRMQIPFSLAARSAGLQAARRRCVL